MATPKPLPATGQAAISDAEVARRWGLAQGCFGVISSTFRRHSGHATPDNKGSDKFGAHFMSQPPDDTAVPPISIPDPKRKQIGRQSGFDVEPHTGGGHIGHHALARARILFDLHHRRALKWLPGRFTPIAEHFRFALTVRALGDDVNSKRL
jgi:hypothetical protein